MVIYSVDLIVLLVPGILELKKERIVVPSNIAGTCSR